MSSVSRDNAKVISRDGIEIVKSQLRDLIVKKEAQSQALLVKREALGSIKRRKDTTKLKILVGAYVLSKPERLQRFVDSESEQFDEFFTAKDLDFLAKRLVAFRTEGAE